MSPSERVLTGKVDLDDTHEAPEVRPHSDQV
jgi:hypothetical protein